MIYPLYEFYSKSPMDLYEVRRHFLEHFYYQKHSRKDAEGILRSVVSSSKVGRLLRESATRNIVPDYKDFLSIVNSMWKFMFKSNDTQVLAVKIWLLDGTLRLIKNYV